MTDLPNSRGVPRKGVPPNPPPPAPARPGPAGTIEPPRPERPLPPLYVVHKWRLRDDRDVTIDIEAGARILKVSGVGSAVFLWALVRRGALKVRRRFRLVGDDAPIVPLIGEALNYIGSSTPGGDTRFNWHVFEIGESRESAPPSDRETESPDRGGNGERA